MDGFSVESLLRLLKGIESSTVLRNVLVLITSLSITSLSFMPNLHSGIPVRYVRILILPLTSDCSGGSDGVSSIYVGNMYGKRWF
jgi:hypothetical protein